MYYWRLDIWWKIINFWADVISDDSILMHFWRAFLKLLGRVDYKTFDFVSHMKKKWDQKKVFFLPQNEKSCFAQKTSFEVGQVCMFVVDISLWIHVFVLSHIFVDIFLFFSIMHVFVIILFLFDSLFSGSLLNIPQKESFSVIASYQVEDFRCNIALCLFRKYWDFQGQI